MPFAPNSFLLLLAMASNLFRYFIYSSVLFYFSTFPPLQSTSHPPFLRFAHSTTLRNAEISSAKNINFLDSSEKHLQEHY